MRFGVGVGTGWSVNGSSRPHADQSIIKLQWQVHNMKLELVQAQTEILQLQWQIEEVRLLTETLRANGVLMDMMSDEDQMVVKHVLKVLKKGGSV